jgi:glycerol-3-phosphate dehydrogenase
VRLSNGEDIEAKAIVNAAGPWVKHVLNERLGQPSRDLVRLVRGSHILVAKLYEGDHAFILQNDDRRVVFMIPYGDLHTLVGTTDVPQQDSESAQPSFAEVDYLCRAVNRYLAKAVTPHDVLWRYAGVRPLYDDGTNDPSAVTRDYTLRVDDDAGAMPVLSIFGGKITTYRRLAEHVVERLEPYFPNLKAPWTAQAHLPGSDFGSQSRVAARDAFFARHPEIPTATLRAIFRRHGTHADQVVGDGKLGEDYGAGLSERELRYFVDHEWARSGEDVLWRRTKCGLHMTEAQRQRVIQVLGH